MEILENGPGCLRLSVSGMNTKRQIEKSPGNTKRLAGRLTSTEATSNAEHI